MFYLRFVRYIAKTEKYCSVTRRFKTVPLIGLGLGLSTCCLQWFQCYEEDGRNCSWLFWKTKLKKLLRNKNSSDIYHIDIYITNTKTQTFISQSKWCRYKELTIKKTFNWLIDLFVFNATFNNILAISWRPVLVVEEAGVPGENHQPWASNWQTSSLAAASRVYPFFVIYKAGCEPTPYWW